MHFWFSKQLLEGLEALGKPLCGFWSCDGSWAPQPRQCRVWETPRPQLLTGLVALEALSESLGTPDKVGIPSCPPFLFLLLFRVLVPVPAGSKGWKRIKI